VISKRNPIAASFIELITANVAYLLLHDLIVSSTLITTSFVILTIVRMMIHLFDNVLNRVQIFALILLSLLMISQLQEPFKFIYWSLPLASLTPKEELVWIICVYGIVFLQVFGVALTFQKERRTINLKNDSLIVRYNQIIEMYQVLNHNLKTPLANALGKVEVALLTKDTSRLQETKESMLSALEKLNTITMVKKIIAQTKLLDEFVREWQVSFKHEDIVLDFNLDKSQNVQINEESGIALGIALDIFAINSKEAGADKIKISLDTRDSRIILCFQDNGPGLDEKRLALFGQIQQSSKGSSGLGTYLAVRLLEAANIEINYFNKPTGGFEVQMAF
jgi:signal transduction histidine kinase